MKIAVEGCCHGELDKIYETLAFIEAHENIKIDLLIICGDFQAVRNESDLRAMAVPAKYYNMATFHQYYSGQKKAPVLTIFIGGNHEASSYLQELPYGGFVAPNIYYLGYAGVVRFGGLRIAGLSGIYKSHDYHRGHFEHPPYNEDTKRSCYHVRNIDVFRLKQLKQPIDIFLSHDWPRGIYHYGDVDELIRRKKFFRSEIESDSLGSPVAEQLLHHLKPEYWFAAHLHVKFAALVNHQLEDGSTKMTRFLSLDKCLPHRQFLQVIDIDSPVPGSAAQLELDPEWLCMLRSTDHLFHLTNTTCYMPGPGGPPTDRVDYSVTAAELESLNADFGGLFKVPDNFTRTAPVHNPMNRHARSAVPPPQIHINPQTTLLCQMLGLTDPFAVFSGRQSAGLGPALANNDDSLDVDDRDEGILDDSDWINSTVHANSTCNPDEISLDDESSDNEASHNSSSPPPCKRSTPNNDTNQVPRTTSAAAGGDDPSVDDAAESESVGGMVEAGCSSRPQNQSETTARESLRQALSHLPTPTHSNSPSSGYCRAPSPTSGSGTGLSPVSGISLVGPSHSPCQSGGGTAGAKADCGPSECRPAVGGLKRRNLAIYKSQDGSDSD